jgi:hypothetical protein
MTQDITTQEAIKRLEQHFDSREGMLIHNLTMLSSSGQPADITFYRRKPLINVQISTKIAAARLYGLEGQLPRILKRIPFSNGVVASLAEIWTVNPMPSGDSPTKSWRRWTSPKARNGTARMGRRFGR